jgi:hypothetical protein
MLEQRRAKEKGYITLREAAELSNYSPDYIGQLIRAGKIKGEQVYQSVAWVTTEDEINSYLQNKNRTITNSNKNFVFLSDFSKTFFKYSLYFVIALLFLAVLVMQYIFYVTLDDKISGRYSSVAIMDESV